MRILVTTATLLVFAGLVILWYAGTSTAIIDFPRIASDRGPNAQSPYSENSAKTTAKSQTIANTTVRQISLEAQLSSSTDFLEFVEDHEHLAQHEPKFARDLARVMKNCAFMQYPGVVESRMREWAHPREHMLPGSEHLRLQLGTQLIAKCRNLAAQRPQLKMLAQQWALLASELGDIDSRLRRISEIEKPIGTSEPEKRAVFSRAVEEFLELASGELDSYDALRVGSFLTSEQGRALFSPRSPLGQLAKEPHGAIVFACAMGADCTADGSIMREGCISSGLCGYANVQELLQAEAMGSQQLARLSQHAADVAAMIRAGDIAGLTTPR